jgi:hypothetical protein
MATLRRTQFGVNSPKYECWDDRPATAMDIADLRAAHVSVDYGSGNLNGWVNAVPPRSSAESD